MRELKTSKGIIITPEGQTNAFGKLVYGSARKLKDENYHIPAFVKDIANKDWFKKLNYKLNKKNNMLLASFDLSDYGLVTLLNLCYLTTDNKKYKSYAVVSSENITSMQVQLLRKNYSFLKNLTHGGHFTGFVCSDGEISFMYKNIDEFYEKLGIEINKKARKVR